MSSSINIISTKLSQNIYAQTPSPQAFSLTNSLLQENHDTLHIFFRDLNGHSHLVHNLLIRLAAYDDDLPTQRAMPPFDPAIVDKLSDKGFFESQITKIDQYTSFLRFFEKEIVRRGSWKDAVNEYVFSRSAIAEKMLSLMFDGAYHPIIHLGLGVEFEQPGIIAEALAQAAAHASFGTDYFFFEAEEQATEQKGLSQSLVNLLQRTRDTPKLVQAGRAQGLIGTMKMNNSILVDAAEEILDIVSLFKVTEENLERKTAEMLNLCAYTAGAAQRAKDSYQPKIDFFFMHCVTSSIFFSVLIRQGWIAGRDKYAVCGVPKLDVELVKGYKGEKTGNMSWEELFKAVSEQHDDGHVAKFVRALKNGEKACRRFEYGGDFMVKGDMWLPIARMAYETTIETSMQNRWVLMAGMDGAWKEFKGNT
ncbi:hypothetical protein BDW74DRAFT_168101 [Aspergillus multicolor]|uniref:questin oxidase family protein n=1 Tax=Aspergillus multicolor TaxID=41759 RepID=UPI003CCDA4EC